MDEVRDFEAKNRLDELLDRAERGEEVTITRAGKPVAKLVPMRETAPAPPRTAADIERAREAMRRIRELAKEMNLGPFDWEEWKRYRDEGRP
jgi:prevent-host-death family protein